MQERHSVARRKRLEKAQTTQRLGFPNPHSSRRRMSRLVLLSAALCTLAFTNVHSQETDETPAFAVQRTATIDHPLLVLPRASADGEARVDDWQLSVTIEDDVRVYRATRGDRVHTHRTPLAMPQHVAFNPDTSRFERLAQNLRVELSDPDALEYVIETAGGTGGKAFPLLGFAYVHLPADADPVRALQSIKDLSVVVSVRLTVKGPKRVPR